MTLLVGMFSCWSTTYNTLVLVVASSYRTEAYVPVPKHAEAYTVGTTTQNTKTYTVETATQNTMTYTVGTATHNIMTHTVGTATQNTMTYIHSGDSNTEH